jgi:Cof subfamily protein (haloacid dehalogenase superfamily)
MAGACRAAYEIQRRLLIDLVMKQDQSIKLVALDLDGTLLDHQAQVTPPNMEAIRRVQARGVGVLLATGKTHESAVPVIEALDLTLPGVFFQGHLICEADGRVLRQRSMDPQHAAAVLAYVRRQELPVVVYDRQGLWTFTDGAHRDLVFRKYAEPLPRLVADPAESDGFMKILIATAGAPAALRGDLQARFGRDLRVLQAIPEFIEVMSPDVSKGEGVAWLLDYLGVDPRAVLAIGDGENDIEMLQLAGCGVAMGNAPDAVKAAAGAVVATNDQSGVAEALQRFVLNSS